LLMNDLFGKDASSLKEKKLFLFDMDGTIYEDQRVFAGALELLSTIRRLGGKYVFITNNSSTSVRDYLQRLKAMGIEAQPDNFFTSAQATALYLKEKHPGQLAYCLGTRSLLQEFRDSGIAVTGQVDDRAEVIVVGFDTELTYAKIRQTCEMLSKDLPYLATNPDLACPAEFGFVPDCGAICEMLALATGKRPLFLGKPNAAMVDYVVRNSVFSKEQTVVIGDRLYTDIAVGVNAGVSTVCVLTGEAQLTDIEASSSKPEFVLPSVQEILTILAE
jgi:4-nitrophenyl phosphatase